MQSAPRDRGRVVERQHALSRQLRIHLCLGDGDCYQAIFEAEDPDSPYLLIQRQFEDPDDDRCYIETHDEQYCGHFLLRRVDFMPQKLSIELDRARDNLISVAFAMAAMELAETSHVVKIICGEIEPP